MQLFLASLGLLALSGVLSLFLNLKTRSTVYLPVVGVLFGSILGSIPAVGVLLGSPSLSYSHSWAFPYGSFSVGIDPLSAFFLIILFLMGSLCAVFSISNPPKRTTYLFFNLLLASMALTLAAQNAVLFLLAWEAMALTSFFLVVENHEEKAVRDAGVLYLICAHIGTAFLLVFFILLHRASGSFEFSACRGLHYDPSFATLLFVLALLGFGSKAGFFPLHVWLPEAHPAAPSFVSALMSGVLIKVGIYGLFRSLPFLGTPQPFWGWVLIAIGAVSGVGGVLFALAQHDLKKLLAYHSVENIGIILLGLGLGVLGFSIRSPLLSFLGFAGALLHVLNHALFKGLLFLAAGGVLHLTGTRSLEHLGGLSKKAPALAVSFLIGACAICGLPPLNGFVSEFLIYLGAFQGRYVLSSVSFIPFLATLFSLAAMGGLCLACFTKVFGIVFLGEARHPEHVAKHDLHFSEKFPLLCLSLLCFGLGLSGPILLKICLTVFQGSFFAESFPFLLPAPDELDRLSNTFFSLSAFFLFLVGLGAVLFSLRTLFFSNRKTTRGVTWDCGYSAPSAKMQYTASSYVQPITQWFRPVLRSQKEKPELKGIFPSHSRFVLETRDLILDGVYRPVLRIVEFFLHFEKIIQHGKMQYYLIYILGTLIFLLLLQLGWGL